MRSSTFGLFASIIIIAVVIIAGGSLFTVGQNQQALVLRLGEPVPGRALIPDPGLHFKLPFVETVV